VQFTKEDEQDHLLVEPSNLFSLCALNILRLSVLNSIASLVLFRVSSWIGYDKKRSTKSHKTTRNATKINAK